MNPRTLSPCPSSPNCVSTQATDEGPAIVPFRYWVRDSVEHETIIVNSCTLSLSGLEDYHE